MYNSDVMFHGEGVEIHKLKSLVTESVMAVAVYFNIYAHEYCLDLNFYQHSMIIEDHILLDALTIKLLV